MMRDTVEVAQTDERSCMRMHRSGSGYVQRRVRASSDGYVTARLHASGGEWDLAVFKRSGGRAIASSAYRGINEVAGGFVRRGQRLTLQACRRSGEGETAVVRLDMAEIELSDRPDPPRLVRVTTPTPHSKDKLLRLDLDVTEEAGDTYVFVVLHGPVDARKLRRAGFEYIVLVEDMSAELSAAQAPPAMPSGRTSYRHLADYSLDMQQLAATNPDLVKPITLPHPSWEGRPVEGLEITTDPNARDGKPVFVMLGLHHAREWPSGEMTIEYAYDLIQRYRAGDQVAQALVENSRLIIVPVVNPDGFEVSRESSPTFGAFYQRKNCRPDPNPGTCAQRAFMNLWPGVDVNRNYGDLWGGIGSSDQLVSEVTRGPEPFSEPEAQNVRELVSSRQVVMLVTNHTTGRKILRQPGLNTEPPTRDEELYRQVGDDMAAENGFVNRFSWQLYNHVGTTDGWVYYATGALAYVFESHSGSFAPEYSQVIGEYRGVGGLGGNSGAFTAAHRSAIARSRHSVVAGTSTPGAILRLEKTVETPTSIGPSIRDELRTEIEIPASGQFEWHMNPSTSPRATQPEAWTVTCEPPGGRPVEIGTLEIARGEIRRGDLSCKEDR
jgi:hypothetical protein